MSDLRSRIGSIRADPPVAPGDPVTAITGLSASTAAQYADPDATPDSYFGRETVVETVAELVCSDATVRAVPSQFRWRAILDLLAAPVTADDVVETVERRRDAPGGIARLFGEPADDFDPTALTTDDLRTARFYTAHGTAVSHDGPVFVPLSVASETVAVDAFYTLGQRVWRADARASSVDTEAMHPATVFGAVMEMYRRDEVVLTSGTDPSTLTTVERVREAVATALPVDGVVAASLLMEANFADVDAPGTVLVRGYEEPGAGQRTPYCAFVPPEGTVRCGMAAGAGIERLSAASLAEAVRNYLA